MSAAGELAMTARDLALWNIAVMNRAVLKPASYVSSSATTLLADGAPPAYGLGVNVAITGGRRQISHGGEVSGFTARSEVYPDEKAAIVVFTNIYPGAGEPGQIGYAHRECHFCAGRNRGRRRTRDRAKIDDGLLKGTIDRSPFTPAANADFTQEVLADYAASLAPLGAAHRVRRRWRIAAWRHDDPLVSHSRRRVVTSLTTMTLLDEIDQGHHRAVRPANR